jgi:hypothetical protein
VLVAGVPLLLFGCGSGEIDPRGSGSGPGGTEVPGTGDPGTDGDGLPSNYQSPRSDKCKRVDLVIAVDNSGSMKEEMTAMRTTVFPAFAAALRQVGGGLEDYRVAVVDACPRPPTFHTRGKQGDCAFASGQSWMDSDSPALAEEFACVGEIDSSDAKCSGDNDDEMPASAAAAALEQAGAQGDNAGFLRDDALLVVVAITDEDETPIPSATADEVYQRLAAIKGDVRKMVLLGIGGSKACDGAYGSADPATKLRALTELFIAQQRGVWWDLCQGKLEDGLTAAMTVIEEACDKLPTVM